MQKTDIAYFILPGGYRLVCRQARVDVGCFGFSADAGSRQELAPNLHGIAHFVEHTIFKGTTHRRAHHINNRMEAVGGELNAFTTKDEITVYAIFPKGNLSRAVELLADLAHNAIFPEHELQKEIEVVIEEINSYLDTPAELVFDEFENRIFANSSLGHSILGTTDNISQFRPEQCKEFVDSHFVPHRMVLFYLGPDSPNKVFEAATKYFKQREAAGTLPVYAGPAPAPLTPFNAIMKTGSHQAHTALGTIVPGQNSQQRYALSLITNIIGGPGMNSRLNTELREKRGLVYSTDASLALLSDCGLFTIYMGCNPKDTNRCIQIANGIIENLATAPLSGRKLEAAKKQYLGQLTVAASSIEHSALAMGHAMLVGNAIQSATEIASEIKNLTPDDLAQAAQMLRNPSSLTIC